MNKCKYRSLIIDSKEHYKYCLRIIKIFLTYTQKNNLMRKLFTNSIAVSILSAASFTANANDFTVQVGAYQVLTNQAISRAEQHGEVYQSIGNDNLTRLHVGRFASKADALNKRDQLRRSGYNDAFITQISVAPASSHQQNPASHKQARTEHESYSSGNNSFDNKSSSNKKNHSPTSHSNSSTPSNSSRQHSNNGHLAGLTDDEKRKAAFLDGQLRIHSNGQFYTLEQYRQQNR